ncbi:hypothetical protein [Bacteroides sedimenti]
MYLIISLIIPVLSTFLVIAYIRLQNFATTIAEEDTSSLFAYEKKILSDNTFSGKIIAKENCQNDYRLFIKLDSKTRIPDFIDASSFYFSDHYKYKYFKCTDYKYNGYSVSFLNGVMNLKTSKTLYYYSRLGDIMEKDSCSDSIRVNKRKFFYF